MKDYPQNKQQWAEEAYQAMLAAWDVLTQGNPFPTEKQKEKLIEIAVSMACDNRDISDPTFVAHAQDFANDEFMGDYETQDIVEKINFSLCFILAYFDAHLALTMITKEVAGDAITLLRSNYDLTYAGKNQTNVLSINYFEKS